jgi:hypothetical protein
MDGWGNVLFVLYGLPPAIVLAGALMAKLVARLLDKRLGWWPALGIGVVVLVASFEAYAQYLMRTD